MFSKLRRTSVRNIPILDAGDLHPEDSAPWPPEGDTRPFVRWWWLNAPFTESGIERQLDWFLQCGFGGVELAWLDPSWSGRGAIARPEWLGERWCELITFTKRAAESRGLGVDLTFGSCWPFGGTCVSEQDASRSLQGQERERIHLSWDARPGLVLNHLSRGALERYAQNLGPRFAPALEGAQSALFCDSLEISKKHVWTEGLTTRFIERFGYDIEPLVERLHDDPGILYDYRALVGETILNTFYRGFAEECERLGATSRVQCHGAPTDLLSAYSVVDVPESETLLFPPAFSRIPASAAAAAARPVVSCETFTCIYGFPRGSSAMKAIELWKREEVEDLKIVADSVIANGVNQIVWHGAPYDEGSLANAFYASVHVGPDSPFANQLPAFNDYLSRACRLMRHGRPATRLGVYLPNEDMMVRPGRPSIDVPGTADWWEMRTVRIPDDTAGFNPLWISGWQLGSAEVGEDGTILVGELRIPALLVDVDFLDRDSLRALARLAAEGARIALPKTPACPGKRPDPDFGRILSTLRSSRNVVESLDALHVVPFVRGNDLPMFFARQMGDSTLIFFAHPDASSVAFPLSHGTGKRAGRRVKNVKVQIGGRWRRLRLEFATSESLAILVKPTGVCRIDLGSWA